MKNVRLNNGVMMPAIGFGVYRIPENETERVVSDAIEEGYRMFDRQESLPAAVTRRSSLHMVKIALARGGSRFEQTWKKSKNYRLQCYVTMR